MAMLPGAAFAQDERTPPVAPNVQETPLPPAVTLPPPATSPADVSARALTADEAARIALRYQANIEAARGGLEAAQGRSQQARAGLLPSLTLSSGYTHADTLAGSGSTSGSSGTTTSTSASNAPGFQASATARQLLWDFQHTRDTVRQANAQQRAAASGLTRAQSDTVFQAKQAFYSFAQAFRTVGVNETNVRNAQAHLALAQARLKTGLGLPSDVVRAETAVSEAILNLNLAQNSASLAGVALAGVMGVDPRTPLTAADSDEPPVETNDVNALVNLALRSRPEVIQAQANVDAATAGVGAARTSGAPAVSATLGTSARGPGFFPGNQSLTVGATVQWSILDAGATAGRTREARGLLQTAAANLTLARQSAIADVAQAYLNLRSSEQRVTTADAEVANAQEGVRLAEGRYRSGLGTFLDVTDAQSALLTAQTNRVNASAAVDTARAALAHATGAPLPAP
ncbi:MAG TPA: TolC family protein [Armatimonadota bacterium]|jgi:outer membrane protein